MPTFHEQVKAAIKERHDLGQFQHLKRGDHIKDPDDGEEAEIVEVVYVHSEANDEAAVVLFYADGTVGSFPVRSQT
jgi:hypothetical protein